MKRADVVTVAGWGYDADVLTDALGLEGCSVSSVSVQDLALAGPAIDAANGGPSGLAAALADRLQAGPRDIAAWSTGALIALECAAYWPERVSRLLLFSATACFCRQPGYPCGASESQVRAMRAAVSKRPAQALRDFAITAGDSDKGYMLQLLDEACVAALRRGLDYLINVDIRGLLGRIRCTTLLLHGSDDAVVPAQAGKFIHQKLIDSDFRLLQGGSHVPWLTHRQSVRDCSAAFFLT